MASDKITPEEIKEGEEYTFTLRGRAKGRIGASWRIVFEGTPENDHNLIYGATLAAAEIVRHQREPQVGDVGKPEWAQTDNWRVVSVETLDDASVVLVLWNPVNEQTGSVVPSDFTVTRPVSS